MSLITEYLETMRANKLSESSIRNTSNTLNKLSSFKSLDEMTDKDLKVWFSKLDNTESTITSYQVIIKKFYRDIGKSEVVEWIKVRKPKETLNPDDILTTEDINKLIDSTDSHYYKALIAFLFESGCRFSEAQALKWKDMHLTTDGIIANIPTTKTAAGFRKVILPFSSQYLNNLQAFSYGKDEDTIFHIMNWTSNMMLKSIAKKAGITKPATCHRFRHAQATELVRLGMQEAIIRKKLGWTPSSTMIARYQHLNDEDTINATLEINGKRPHERKPREELKEAKPLSIDQAANRLFQLEEENEALKIKMDYLTGLVEAMQSEKDRELEELQEKNMREADEEIMKNREREEQKALDSFGKKK